MPLVPLRSVLIGSTAALVLLGGGTALASTGSLPQVSDVIALVSAERPQAEASPRAQALEARHRALSEQLAEVSAAIEAAERTADAAGPVDRSEDPATPTATPKPDREPTSAGTPTGRPTEPSRSAARPTTAKRHGSAPTAEPTRSRTHASEDDERAGDQPDERDERDEDDRDD